MIFERVQKIAVLVAVAFAFFAGHWTTSVSFERKIAVEKQERLEEAKRIENAFREKEREQAKLLAVAWDEANRARADLDALRASSFGLRDELARANRKLSETAGDSKDSCRKRLAESVEIIRRYDAIASRGLELAHDASVKKDAVVRIVKQ